MGDRAGNPAGNRAGAERDATAERYDDPWDFTVTWNPDSGTIPTPILRLFYHRSTIEPGRAVKRTDKGHATHYVRAVQSYVAKHHPGRADIEASAVRAVPAEGSADA